MAQVGSIITSEIIVDNVIWFDRFDTISREILLFFEKTILLNVRVESLHIEANKPTTAKIFYHSDVIIPWAKV